MKTITLDVINQTAVSETAEGDVGVKLVVTNAPEEWGKCSVYALFTQGEQTQHELIKNPDGKYNVTTVPSEFTDANKAFKIGVYAIGADYSRDVRPSVWIRVMDTDFTTKDLIVTEQTLEDVLGIQALYTAYVESENGREANEKARIEAENERVEAESQRKADISMMKQDISALQGEMKNKVDAEFGMGLSTNDFTDSDAMKLSDIEEGAQKNVQSDWNTSDTKSDAYIKNKPVIDQSYKSKSQNAQSGTAVAQAIAQLVGSAPDKLNTLEELADALKDNADIVDVLNEAIGGKVDKADGYGLSQIDYGTNISGQSFVVLNTVNVDNEPVQIFLYPIAETNALLALKVDTTEYEQFKNSLENGDIRVYNSLYSIYSDVSATAHVADKDSNLNNIVETYATKKELRPTPITEIPTTLSPNQTYHFSEAPASIVFPSADVADGDTIYLTFMTGDTPPTIEFYTTNTTEIDIEIEANTGYEIYGKYVANIGKWIVGYSEYTVSGGEAV